MFVIWPQLAGSDFNAPVSCAAEWTAGSKNRGRQVDSQKAKNNRQRGRTRKYPTNVPLNVNITILLIVSIWSLPDLTETVAFYPLRCNLVTLYMRDFKDFLIIIETFCI